MIPEQPPKHPASNIRELADRRFHKLQELTPEEQQQWTEDGRDFLRRIHRWETLDASDLELSTVETALSNAPESSIVRRLWAEIKIARSNKRHGELTR